MEPNPEVTTERTASTDPPLSDEEQTRKDVSESPGSDAETRAKQRDDQPQVRDPDIDASAVKVLPGTGGPDDPGDVDIDPRETSLPQDPDLTS